MDTLGVEPLVLGYLASSYPRAVDTAVRNEVFGLRERGHTVHTYAVRRTAPEQLTSELHHREAATTTYLYTDYIRRSPLVAARRAAASPGRFADTLRLWWRARPPGTRALTAHAAYLLEAAVLAEDLQAKGVEHLHCHIGENSASVAMLASALSGVPFSVTIHGPYIFRAPDRWALSEKIVRSAFTACITEFTRSQCCIHTPPQQWSKLVIVRCGPEPAFLASEPAPVEDVRRLVWVGRLCEEKGVPVLLDALARLAADGVDFEMVLIGDGPLRGWVEARIAELGLGGRVRITGWMKGEDVHAEVASSRALVLSSFAEGLPAVLMEALVIGRPCVATWIAGIPELVFPGEDGNGWLVPAGDVAALASAVREVLETPVERLRAMGARGREDVLRLQNPALEIPKLEALLAASARGAALRG